MKRFISYIIVVAATLYTAVLYGSDSFLMLVYAEVLLPVFLLGTVLPLTRRIHVQLRLPVPVVERGQRTPVQLLIKNTSFLPSGRIAVQVNCYFPMSRRPQKTWFYGRISGGSLQVAAQGRIRAEYQAQCVGSVKMEISKVRCYDLLGLTSLPVSRKHWKQLEPETLLVLPKISQVPVFVSRESRDYAGESDEYSVTRGGDDPSETFRIRDYQPGDKLRSIHWKLSAKTGEMMVCERSLPLGCPVILYLNLYHPVRGRKGWEINRDNFLQIVASISYGMVQEGCRHYIAWFDEDCLDMERCRIEEEQDVYEMLLQLGRLSLSTEQRELEELYHQKYHESPCVTSLELGMDLKLQYNGSLLVSYSDREEKLEKQLQTIEITV